MRFVPVKTAEQQAALMLAGVRDRLVRNRVQLANAIRGMAAEFGLTAPKGLAQVERLLADIATDMTVPALARALFAMQSGEYLQLEARIITIDAQLLAWHRANPVSRKLAAVPGIGPITASLLVMKTPDPTCFRSGRDFAAWLGLTPKDHSTAGKVRTGQITRAGDETLRSLLVVGATAVIWQTRRGTSRHKSPWLVELLKRKPAKLCAVALANKSARIVWKLMTSEQTYDAKRAVPAALAAAAG
jgi:transposase